MSVICIPLFNFNLKDLSDQSFDLRGLLKLPHLPDPLLPDISSFSLESIANAVQMQAMGVYNLLFQLVGKIIDYLGGSLREFFPDIPILGINLVDILSGNGSILTEIIKRIKEEPMIANILGVFSSLPKTQFNIPSLDALEIFNAIISQYMVFPLQILFEKINKIADILEIAGLTLPIPLPFPSIDSLKSLLFQLSGVDNYIGMIQKVRDGVLKLPDMFTALSLSFGLPFNIPDPLFGDLSIPEIEFSFYLNSFLNNLCYGYLKPMIDFVISKLSSVIPSTFTQICI